MDARELATASATLNTVGLSAAARFVSSLALALPDGANTLPAPAVPLPAAVQHAVALAGMRQWARAESAALRWAEAAVRRGSRDVETGLDAVVDIIGQNAHPKQRPTPGLARARQAGVFVGLYAGLMKEQGRLAHLEAEERTGPANGDLLCVNGGKVRFENGSPLHFN